MSSMNASRYLMPREYMSRQLRQIISKQSLIKSGERSPRISAMTYNTARNELFFADSENNVVRSMSWYDSARDICDVYTANNGGHLWGLCHMSYKDALLVCSCEQHMQYLVALNRSENGWREVHRLQINVPERCPTKITCAQIHSEVLIGEEDSNYLEHFRLVEGTNIERIDCVLLQEEYTHFTAISLGCSTDMLVAMSYKNRNEVRVHRLHFFCLKDLARHESLESIITIQSPRRLLWVDIQIHNNRLLVTEGSDGSITELESRRLLIAADERIRVLSWCAVYEELAIADDNSRDILCYDCCEW